MRKFTVLFLLTTVLTLSALTLKSVDAKVIDPPHVFYTAAQFCMGLYHNEYIIPYHYEPIDSPRFSIEITPRDTIFAIRYQLESVPLMQSFKYCGKLENYTIYSNSDYFEKFVVNDSLITIQYQWFEDDFVPIYDPPYWYIRADSLP